MERIAIYNVETLAAKAGISRRTIHYYLQRGLLMPPLGEGRGCYYTEEHLNRLYELQQLSAQGVPLVKIKEYFEHGRPFPAQSGPDIRFQRQSSGLPPSEAMDTWERYPIKDGIELHIRIGTLPPDTKGEILEEMESGLKKILSTKMKRK